MKIKMKNGSYRCDINRPRSRNGHRYSEYKKYEDVWWCMMMLMYIKQQG